MYPFLVTLQVDILLTSSYSRNYILSGSNVKFFDLVTKKPLFRRLTNIPSCMKGTNNKFG